MSYKEKLLAQKIQLLELALKANLEKPCLNNACLVAKARVDLFEFIRGGK